MPIVDFTNVKLPEEGKMDFSPLPEGEYLCEVEEVDDTGKTKAGDEMWGIKFKVVGGEYDGRYIFDNMVFSDKALPRLKLICSRLGIEADTEVNLTGKSLLGRKVYLDIVEKTYKSKDGTEKLGNSVLFDGYREVDSKDNVGTTLKEEDDDLPF